MGLARVARMGLARVARMKSFDRDPFNAHVGAQDETGTCLYCIGFLLNPHERARASLLEHFLLNNKLLLIVFMLKAYRRQYWTNADILARMWPAWCYLIRIHATDKFDARARAARVASWDRTIEHVLVFQ